MSREVTTVGFPLLKAQTGAGASSEFFNVMADAPPTGRMKGSFTAGVSITGSPLTVTVGVEGSINGADWFDIGIYTFTETNLDLSGALFAISGIPVPYIRGNLIKLIGGTKPSVSMFVSVNEVSNAFIDEGGIGRPLIYTDGRPEFHAVVGGTDGNTAIVNEDGTLRVSLDDLFGVMTDILKETKKTNMHLMLMTDTVIENTEVEV